MKTAGIQERDKHSFSNPDKVSLRHINLELEVDFDAEQIAGRATLYLNPHRESTLVLGLKTGYTARVYPRISQR